MAIRIGEDLLSCVNQSSNFNPTALKDNIWLDSANNQLKTYKGAVKFEQSTRLIPENTSFTDQKYLHMGQSGTNPSWKTFTDTTAITISNQNFTMKTYNSVRLAECLFYVTGTFTGTASSSNKTQHIRFGSITKIDGSNLSISDNTNCTNGCGTVTQETSYGNRRCGTIVCDSGGGCYVIWSDNGGVYENGTYRFQMFISFNNSTIAHGKRL